MNCHIIILNYELFFARLSSTESSLAIVQCLNYHLFVLTSPTVLGKLLTELAMVKSSCVHSCNQISLNQGVQCQHMVSSWMHCLTNAASSDD